MSVTLFSEPGDDGYRTLDRVTVGEKLWLPEPFAMALDTAPLRVQRGAPHPLATGQKASSGRSMRSVVVDSAMTRSAASLGSWVEQKNRAAATFPV